MASRRVCDCAQNATSSLAHPVIRIVAPGFFRLLASVDSHQSSIVWVGGIAVSVGTWRNFGSSPFSIHHGPTGVNIITCPSARNWANHHRLLAFPVLRRRRPVLDTPLLGWLSTPLVAARPLS